MTIVSPSFEEFPRVNLLPRSEIARREREKLVRVWVWAVLGAIVLAMLIIAASFWLKWMADQRLVTEQARTNQLLVEISALSEVSEALTTQAELTAFRSEAMATDLLWSPIVAKITSILPPDSRLSGYTLTVGAAPQGEDPALEPGVTGTVNVDSPTPLDIVAIIRSLRSVDGVMYADGQSVTSTEGSGFKYLLNVEFDQTAYSGEFAVAEDGDE